MSENKWNNSENKINIIIVVMVSLLLLVILWLFVNNNGWLNNKTIKNNVDIENINKPLTWWGSLDQVTDIQNVIKDDNIDELAKELWKDLSKEDLKKEINIEDNENIELPVENDVKVFKEKYIKVSSILLWYDKTKEIDKNDKIEQFLKENLSEILKNNPKKDISLKEDDKGTIESDVFWELFTKYYQIDPS